MRANKNIINLIFLLLLSLPGFAQTTKINSATITLRDVEVVGKRIKHPFIFSTFINSPFRTGHITEITDKSNILNIANFPVGVKVNNIYNENSRVDSILIKGDGLDSNQIKLFFQIYHNGKLFNSSSPQFISKNKRIYKFMFKNGLYFPNGISYFSFSFQTKNSTSLKLYTNLKIKGFLYSYNKDENIFKLTDPEHNLDLPIYCPQIKLFYTLMPK